MRRYYDLHLHSCLSPCGGGDMTPANLAAMCMLAGLNVVALTDHNTTGNCGAFCRAAASRGLLALPGMELCTREDIHVICLFPTLERADDFSAHVARQLPPMANRPEFFGRQLLMDEGDTVLGEETALLAGSTGIHVEEAAALVSRYGGVAYPAHIDRPAFSLLSVLGLWVPDAGFPLAEVSRNCPPGFLDRPDLRGLRTITASDAHQLDQVAAAEHWMDLPADTADAVLDWLIDENLTQSHKE